MVRARKELFHRVKYVRITLGVSLATASVLTLSGGVNGLAAIQGEGIPMENNRQNNGGELHSDLEHEELKSRQRREALLKMGRFAMYTAPAVVAILASSRDAKALANGSKVI